MKHFMAVFLICLLTKASSLAADLGIGSNYERQEINLEQANFKNLAIGRNGYVTIGSTSGEWLAATISPIANNGGVLGLYTHLGLTGDAAVILDPARATPALPPAGQLEFARNSLLVVNGKTSPYASIGAIYAEMPHFAHAQDGAALMITSVKAGRSYRVFGNNIESFSQEGNGWSGNLAMTDSHVLGLEKSPSETGLFKVVPISAQEVYPSLDDEIGDIIDNGGDPVPPAELPQPDKPTETPLPPYLEAGLPLPAVGTDEEYINSSYAGVRFLSRVTSIRYMGWDYDKVVKTLESASRLAILAAVPQMLMAANSTQTEAIKARISLLERFNGAIEYLPENRQTAFWITPVFRASNGFDLHANNYSFDFSGRLGGINAGCDLTLANAFRFGAALTMGGGYAESGGDLARTINKMEFWGAGLYGSWLAENFSAGLDVTYTASSSSVTQNLPSSLEMRNLTGKFTARAISAGLSLEYDLPVGYWQIIPHAGLRLLYSHTDDYSIYSNGALMDGRAIDQTIWLFPAGISIKANFESKSGWHISPLADIAIVSAAGEIEAKTKIFYTGTHREATLHTQTRDYLTIAGTLGAKAKYGNFSMAAICMLEGGLRTSAESVQASFCYEF